MRIESAAAARGIGVAWKAFLLGPIFRSQGWNARIACAFASEPWLPAFVRAVYDANFARDEDISTPAVIARCLASAGQRPDALLAAAESEASKAKLRAQAEEAMRLGLFGAPSFVVGHELFWGNDRLETALAWQAAQGAGRG